MKIACITANIGGIDAPNIHVKQDIPKDWTLDFFIHNDMNTSRRINSLLPRMQGKIYRMSMMEMHPGYDYYIWHDSSISMSHKDFVTWAITSIGKKDMAVFKHPDRNNIQEEIDYIDKFKTNPESYLGKRYMGEPIQSQLDEYKKNPLFKDNFLIASGCFIQKNNKRTEKMMKDWMWHCYRWSSLDQASLPYVICTNKISFEIFDGNILKHNLIKYNGHKTDRPMETKQEVDVVMLALTVNEKIHKMTQEAIDTLHASSDSTKFNVILIESNMGSCKLAGQYKDCTVTTCDKPFGYNTFMNYGARLGKADHIVFVNNDLIFHDKWWEKLYAGMGKYNLDSASPKCPIWFMQKPLINPVHMGYRASYEISGWCIAMKRSNFDKIGGFDERFLYYGADNSYGCQLYRGKIRHGLITDSKVTHLFNTTPRRTDKPDLYIPSNVQMKKEYPEWGTAEMLWENCELSKEDENVIEPSKVWDSKEKETIDVIMLANTTTLHHYTMTQNAIDSIHKSSSEITFNVVVMETSNKMPLLDRPEAKWIEDKDYSVQSENGQFRIGNHYYPAPKDFKGFTWIHEEREKIIARFGANFEVFNKKKNSAPATDGPVTYSNATVIQAPLPFNYNVNINEGLKHGNAPWVCVMNSDVLVFGGAFDKMIAAGYDSVSPFSTVNAGGQGDLAGNEEGYMICRHMMGFCILSKREVFSKLPNKEMDPNFWFYHQDCDFAMQLIRLGIKHGVVKDARVDHLQCQSHPNGLFSEKDKQWGLESTRRFYFKYPSDIENRTTGLHTGQWSMEQIFDKAWIEEYSKKNKLGYGEIDGPIKYKSPMPEYLDKMTKPGDIHSSVKL